MTVGDRAREQHHPVGTAHLRVLAGEHRLVREDVALVRAQVVELPQLVVEEARRAGDREHPGRLQVVDVAPGAVELPVALLLAERLLRGAGQLVDHRVPDCAAELQQVRVHMPEFGEEAQVGGAGVVLVEQPDAVVLDPQRGVADRTVGGGRERLDEDVQAAVQLVHLIGPGLEERGEAERPQLVLHLGGGELRQQDGGLLADEPLEVLGVEVVAVQVRDVEVVDVAEGLPVELGVVREGEPGGEVRGVDPRIGENAARRRVDPHARVPGTGDLHRKPPPDDPSPATLPDLPGHPDGPSGPGDAGRGRLTGPAPTRPACMAH